MKQDRTGSMYELTISALLESYESDTTRGETVGE
jgi:hypothetical protein